MKRRIIILSIFLLIGLVIGISIFEYSNRADKIRGSYFRKMYGSLGMVNEEDYSIRIDLFSFNNSAEFLDDVAKLSFDNQKVSIKGVSYEEQSREKDLVVYAVNFSVSIKENGRYDITTLNYQDGDKTISYPLGKLSFICEYGNSIYLHHGCNTTILDGKAAFTFSSKNQEAFTITDIKLAEEKNVNYTYKKDVSYVPGEELLYELNIDYSVEDGALFVVQPIFIIKVKGEKRVQYFTPNILEYSGDELTYPQIKEYIK